MPRQKPFLPQCVPDDVGQDGVSWEPTWAEKEFDRYQRAQIIYERDWIAAEHQKLAAIALEIANDRRRAAVAEHFLKQEQWWAEQQKQNDDIAQAMVEYQRALDAPRLKVIWDRVNKAGAEIKRDAMRLEREELKRRGVYR